MPNVPNVPGVPNLTTYLDTVVTLLVADAVAFLFGAPANPWGVYLDGELAFSFDSFTSIAFKKDYMIADYKVEAPGDGLSSGFMSYDKVEMPFECRVRLTKGGSEQDREELLSEVTAAAASLELFDVVTPERLYTNCNIQRFSYDRSAQDGVGMLKIDVVFQEIRSSESSAFSNTQQPGSSSQKGLGNVQPLSPGAASAAGLGAFPLGSVQ